METHLDPKTQLLVALGAAIAARCQTCFTKLYASAGPLAVSDAEIRAVAAIAAKVAAKAQDFMGTFVAEATHGAVRVPGAAGGPACSC